MWVFFEFIHLISLRLCGDGLGISWKVGKMRMILCLLVRQVPFYPPLC